MDIRQACDKLEQLKEEIHKEFIGKDEVLDHLLVCLLAGGHVLLEDVPGIGKTTLAKVLAKSAGLSLGRIQFTPDTLPGDITGISVYDMQSGEFRWKQGPVMNQILLADEINRTSPKTQAGLLEVMAEGQVTVDGKSFALPEPFMVISTQNPVEFAGTYPLPEAQMDRFMMKLSMGYPEKEQEFKIAKALLAKNAEEAEEQQTSEGVLNAADILEIRKLTGEVRVSDAVINYIESIIAETRKEERFRLGGSTRALLALLQASQAKALLDGRDFVKPDDVKALVTPVLAHRMVLSTEARRQKVSVERILTEILTHVRIPA